MSGNILGFLKHGTSAIMIEITGKLDRKGFESLQLDIANVATKHGLTLKKMELKTPDKPKK